MEASFKFDEWEAHHWTELQSLYHLAADAPPGQRTHVLRAATTDEGLMQRVLNLLEMDSEDESADADDRYQVRAIDDRIGPYRLVRLLGSGGLGAVYLAERLHGGAVRQYALKLLSLHAVGPEMQTRFLREQQLLALLQHANIPRMLDAGFTDTGRPYLAMEYIDGEAITTHCDAAAMTVRDRVRLMLQVCEAVAYAHRMLVVHLDLKPQNILVSRDGQAKLLDFGTSKLLDAELTLTTTILATPAYASPEQLRNEPITTACDVYGLGAVLYELLCGSRPWGSSSPTLILEHALREDEPPPLHDRLSEDNAQARGETTVAALRQQLRGDVQSIVARCLRSQAASRFSTVDALAEDLRRYLRGHPILSRRQTVRYRLRKFIARHTVPVLSIAFAALVILFSLGYAVMRQQQALRNAQRAMQMQAFLSQLFKLANPEHTGKPAATVPQFLHLGASVLPQLVADPADRRAAELSLAESMYDSGEEGGADKLFQKLIVEAQQAGDLPTKIQAETYSGAIAYNAGNVPRGEALTKEALSGATHSQVLPLARIRAKLFYVLNREEEGYRTQENLDLAESALAESRSAHLPPHDVAYALTSVAGMLAPRGRIDEQEHLLKEALTIYDSEPWAVCDRAAAESGLALIDNQRRDFHASLQHAQEAYRDQSECFGENSRRALEGQGFVAAALISSGSAAQAVPLLEASLPRWVALVGPDSDQLATPLLFLTRAYNGTGQFVKAETTAANLVRVEQPRINPHSAQMGICQLVWAQALAGQHKRTEALAHAVLADSAFRAENSRAPGTMHNAATAAELRASLEADDALAAHSGPKK